MKSKELKLLRKKLEKASKASYTLSTTKGTALASSATAADGKENISVIDSPNNAVSFQYWNPDEVKSASNKNGSRLQELLDLFEANMCDQYRNSSWGLDMEEKKTELSHTKARYLVLLDSEAHQKCHDNIKDKDEEEGKPNNAVQDMIGFCHYRFEYDDEDTPTEPVLYVYELQIRESHRRQGLGNRAMTILEDMAQSMEIPKVMLTVFRSNDKAMDFYQGMHYEVDAISPSKHGQVVDYEILSKRVL